ncbi:Fe-S-containing protein [Trichloromonas sp.]|uniref:Fe-S-containing protein n=1 Tax=Trichloromonas sp. TaxID=3069249 RepID=UPI003D81C3C5
MSDRDSKRAQFDADKKKNYLPLLAFGLLLLAGVALIGWKFIGTGEGKYPLVTAVAGQVSIPVARLDDGNAHFFSYRQGETVIDFFVLKSHDGVLRAAFDACDVCYREKKGYRQEGDEMVCVNCGQRFSSDRINEVKGGCNPAPLVRNVANGNLVITEQDLKLGARYFEGI